MPPRAVEVTALDGRPGQHAARGSRAAAPPVALRRERAARVERGVGKPPAPEYRQGAQMRGGREPEYRAPGLSVVHGGGERGLRQLEVAREHERKRREVVRPALGGLLVEELSPSERPLPKLADLGRGPSAEGAFQCRQSEIGAIHRALRLGDRLRQLGPRPVRQAGHPLDRCAGGGKPGNHLGIGIGRLLERPVECVERFT